MTDRSYRHAKALGSRSRGFTLVEMLVVILIVGTAMSIWATALRPLRERSLLTSFESSLIELIHKARATALRDGVPVRISIALEQRRLEIPGNRALAVPNELALDVSSASESGSASIPTVLFLPDGTNSGARFEIGIAGSEGSRRRLDLSWASGTISRAR